MSDPGLRRQPSCDGTSRMMREYHVQICEGLGVKFVSMRRRPHAYAVNRDRGRSFPTSTCPSSSVWLVRTPLSCSRQERSPRRGVLEASQSFFPAFGLESSLVIRLAVSYQRFLAEWARLSDCGLGTDELTPKLSVAKVDPGLRCRRAAMAAQQDAIGPYGRAPARVLLGPAAALQRYSGSLRRTDCRAVWIALP
jgi:hypothetical protein